VIVLLWRAACSRRVSEADRRAKEHSIGRFRYSKMAEGLAELWKGTACWLSLLSGQAAMAVASKHLLHRCGPNLSKIRQLGSRRSELRVVLLNTVLHD
jgi:hypothetical protein